MAEKKSGPVKPPIIDAKPRADQKNQHGTGPAKAEAATPASQSARSARPTPAEPAQDKASGKPQTEPVRPKPAEGPAKTGAAHKGADADAPGQDRGDTDPGSPSASADAPIVTGRGATPIMALAPLVTAAGSGALLGLVLVYGLASFGLWPNPNSQGLGDLQGRTQALEDALAQQEAQTTTALGAMDAELAGRLDEIGAGATREGLATQTDLETLQQNVSDLSARVEALAAGASGENGEQMAGQLSGLNETISTLTERLDAIEPQIDTLAPALEDAQTRLDDLDARIADQADFEALSAERDRIAQFPATLDALDARLAAGEPFSGELATLEGLLPNLEISDAARSAAGSGVTPAGALLSQFRAAIPAMLAARPESTQESWAQTLINQAASALALRSTEGAGPDGLVARTEAALEAAELDQAQSAFDQLPAQMQAAAPGFGAALAQSVAAYDLADTARAQTPQTATEADQ